MLDTFLSIHIASYTIFYKFYIEDQQPEITDLADLMYLASIPYCELAILDKDVCRILNIINSNHNLFKDIKVRDGRFLTSILQKPFFVDF